MPITKSRITHAVVALAAIAATALVTPAFAGDGASSPAKDWIRNRYNNDHFPVIVCPPVCVAPDCSRFPNNATGVCYDTSEFHPYWDAVRISLTGGTGGGSGGGGTYTITQCAEYAAVATYTTWNGDQTGSLPAVRAKQNAMSARAWLDDKEVKLVENPRTDWQTLINGSRLSGDGTITAPTQRISDTCDNYMANSGDCPPEISRDTRENCYQTSFGYDLSNLSEGAHTFTLTVELDKGFPNATNCTTTRPNCYSPLTTAHRQEFGDDEACSRTLTIHINNTVPGGC